MKPFIRNMSSLRQFVDGRIIELQSALDELKSDIGPARVHLAGALRTGHYIGPKPKYLSFNPDCPFETVVEADIRILLQENKHPHDPVTINAVRRVIQPDFEPKSREIYDWHRLIPVTHFYKYEKLSDTIGFEWEFALNKKPYVDVALVWQRLFTPTEIVHQREVRKALYSLRPLSYEEEYTPAKRVQNFEARWRLVASCALAQLQVTGRAPKDLRLPVEDVPEEPVYTLIQKWLAGESGYRTMERPEVVVPNAIKHRLQKILGREKLDHLLIQPPQPRWAQVADAIQRDLKANYAKQSTATIDPR